MSAFCSTTTARFTFNDGVSSPRSMDRSWSSSCPLLDGFPSVQSGVQSGYVLTDHFPHRRRVDQLLVGRAVQSVLPGPPRHQVGVKGNQCDTVISGFPENHELTGIGTDRHEPRLDRRRGDVLATGGLEDVLDPAGHGKEPVGVDVAHVAGAQPAVVGERLGRLIAAGCGIRPSRIRRGSGFPRHRR